MICSNAVGRAPGAQHLLRGGPRGRQARRHRDRARPREPRCRGRRPKTTKVAERMTTDLDTVDPKTDIAEAADHMARLDPPPARRRRASFAGIISIRDLTNWAVHELTSGHELPDLERQPHGALGRGRGQLGSAGSIPAGGLRRSLRTRRRRLRTRRLRTRSRRTFRTRARRTRFRAGARRPVRRPCPRRAFERQSRVLQRPELREVAGEQQRHRPIRGDFAFRVSVGIAHRWYVRCANHAANPRSRRPKIIATPLYRPSEHTAPIPR